MANGNFKRGKGKGGKGKIFLLSCPLPFTLDPVTPLSCPITFFPITFFPITNAQSFRTEDILSEQLIATYQEI
jgi:hypothetical protein